ncbi:hypothetical protein [Lysinibacillus sphaericus]|uniref:hypothetical protein n=1 Tax=Lysinibacillus TaxID=400634 RepID=UPI00077799F2|nr:hypothetical protein [Lysinibacillus sphaericus]MBE5086177.1 hypothetical protein [Bacillus thuringiensis]AMO35319.1 hypothetical protein AR327_22780 [Lysinibacillus sphaericus]AMR93078.1 hypothetical protein A1T07_23005 [Lysinibacillus sphaericus]MBG9710747.1 hypothetical protein [Lysinibacillus sphaericus]MBG9730354.1 hypothetical protein [Lysinibacillus sphaericus]
MNINKILKLFFNKESEVIRYNEAGIYVENKELEINGLSYTRSPFYFNENTRSTLKTYSNARKGRKAFKVEEIDFLEIYEMHPFYWNNLKGDSFCGHFMNIKEDFSDKEVLDELNNLKEKFRDDLKIISYLNAVEEELKKSTHKSKKDWILVFVDEEHVQNFINYIKQFSSFKFKELNFVEN